MPSLSSYDRGKKAMEGRRYVDDIEIGNQGMALLDAPTNKSNWSKRKRGTAEYLPRKVLLRGNHEERIVRAINDDARFDGALSLDALESPGWEVIPFLQVEKIDGINYSHYFYNVNTGRPYGGDNLATRLKTIGHSFTMGHQQGLKVCNTPTIGGMTRGLVAGTCYLHNESYLGPQGNREWRGIIVCHDVKDGDYSLMEVPLDYLCRKYEGMPLDQFLSTNYPDLEV